MVWETGVQSQDESYQKLKKWYLMLLGLTRSIIKYGSRVSVAIQGKELHILLHLGVVAIEKRAFRLSSITTIIIWPIDGTLTEITTPGGPKNKVNGGVFYIFQSSRSVASPSDGLVSYPRYSLAGSYPSAEMQSAYSTASADWLCPIPHTVIPPTYKHE